MATTIGITVQMPEDRDAWEVLIFKSDGEQQGLVSHLTSEGVWEETPLTDWTEPTIVLDARTVILGPPWLRPLLEAIVSHDKPLNLIITKED